MLLAIPNRFVSDDNNKIEHLQANKQITHCLIIKINKTNLKTRKPKENETDKCLNVPHCECKQIWCLIFIYLHSNTKYHSE